MVQAIAMCVYVDDRPCGTSKVCICEAQRTYVNSGRCGESDECHCINQDLCTKREQNYVAVLPNGNMGAGFCYVRVGR